MVLYRRALDALEGGTAKAFAVDVRAEHSYGIQNLKEKVSESLRTFQQTGVLHEREYHESVPASVHGAPRTAEVHGALSEVQTAPVDLPSLVWMTSPVLFIAKEALHVHAAMKEARALLHLSVSTAYLT